MTEHIDSLFDEAYEVLRRQEAPSFPDWAEQYFKLSVGATQAEDEMFEPEPWQRAIMFCLANTSITKMWVVKGAQIGWSQMLKALLAYELAVRGRGVCIFQPRDQDRDRYSAVQISTLARDCKPFAEAMIGKPGVKSPDNKTDMVMFQLATLYLGSMQSAANFRDINCATAIVDEYSAAPRTVGAEGDAASNAFGRAAAASWPTLRVGSTPKDAEDCQISEAVETVHYQFEYHHPCPHCGHYQTLKQGGADTDKDGQEGAKYGMKYDKVFYPHSKALDVRATSETVSFMCESEDCHKCYSHEQYMAAAASGGVWLAHDLGICSKTGAFFDRDTGYEREPPYELSFKAPQFISHRPGRWKKICATWCEANRKLKLKNDPSSIIQYVQEVEGRAYEPPSLGDIPLWEAIRDKRTENYYEIYGAECPQQVQYITGHIDVHPNFSVLEVRGWGFEMESWSLDYFLIEGSPLVTNEAELLRNEAWIQLLQHTLKRYTRPDKSFLQMSVCGVDAGWKKDIAKTLQQYDRAFFIPMIGHRDYGHPVCTPPSKNPDKDGVYLLWVGTDTAKQLILENHCNTELPGDPGYLHYPDRDFMPSKFQYDDDLFKQLPSEKKKSKLVRGVWREVWVQRSGSIRNEFLDTHVNNLCLMYFLQIKRGAILTEYQPKAAEAMAGGADAGPVHRSTRGVAKPGRLAQRLFNG